MPRDDQPAPPPQTVCSPATPRPRGRWAMANQPGARWLRVSPQRQGRRAKDRQPHTPATTSPPAAQGPRGNGRRRTTDQTARNKGETARCDDCVRSHSPLTTNGVTARGAESTGQQPSTNNLPARLDPAAWPPAAKGPSGSNRQPATQRPAYPPAVNGVTARGSELARATHLCLPRWYDWREGGRWATCRRSAGKGIPESRVAVMQNSWLMETPAGWPCIFLWSAAYLSRGLSRGNREWSVHPRCWETATGPQTRWCHWLLMPHVCWQHVSLHVSPAKKGGTFFAEVP